MPSSDPPPSNLTGDLGRAVQMLAADNARLCDIAIAADKLADEMRKARGYLRAAARDALDAYTIVRNGQ